MKCPKCDKEAILAGPPSRHQWRCQDYPKCDHYVGCHPGSDRPLGTLADRRTREARIDTHNLFDLLWKEGHMSRSKAYAAISKQFGKEIHMGESDYDMCQRIQNLVRVKLRKLGRAGRLIGTKTYGG